MKLPKKCPDCGKKIKYSSIRCNRCTRRFQAGPIEDRFWLKVNKDGPTMPHMETACWIWIGRTSRRYANGKFYPYGIFDLFGKAIYAHRLSWELVHNQSVPKELHILHHCDNPICINPEHLFLGTHGDNMRDMASKNRTGVKRGINNHNTKLTPEQVIEIRRRYIPRKVSQQTLAKEYNVTQTAIFYILNHKNWK